MKIGFWDKKELVPGTMNNEKTYEQWKLVSGFEMLNCLSCEEFWGHTERRKGDKREEEGDPEEERIIWEFFFSIFFNRRLMNVDGKY